MLLSDLYNFKIHIKKAITWGYPVRNKPGEWDGVVGMLQRHEADFGAVALTYLPGRQPIMDSGLSVQKFRQYLIFRHPHTTKGMKNVFVTPLQTKVWIVLFSILLLTTIFLYVTYLHDIKERKLIDNSPFISSMITVVAIISNQGIIGNFNSMQARIILLFSLILSIVCLQFYSASIVSSLLTPAPRTITTMKDLAESDLEVIMEDIPTSKAAFRVTIDENAILLRETKIVKHNELYSIEEGVALVKKGNYAFYTYVDYAYDFMKNTFTHSELDDLQEITFYPPDHRSMLYMAIEKHSPFKELIRVGNQKFIETGIKSYVTSKFTSKTPRGNLNSQMFKNAVVDIQSFSSLLYMLCIGMIFSFVIFIFEIFAGIIKRYRT